MIETNTHKLKKPEQSDFILDTIDALSENFEIIDKLIDDETLLLDSYLVEGDRYESGKRIWNINPSIGDSIGWVNIRNGVYAPSWSPRKTYVIGDMVTSSNNNGHIYECVENGFSGISEPLFPTASNGNVFDHTGALGWLPNKIYSVNDIVLSTNGNNIYHYRCIVAGTSESVEPSWALNSGSTISDGSVVWQSYKTVKWREVGVSCEFRQFGIIV